MDCSEKIAYQYLKTIYPCSYILFEPNGYKTYPDFKCGESEYEVSSLYQVNQGEITLEEYEAPILRMIQKNIVFYNRETEDGFYFFINIKSKLKNKNDFNVNEQHLKKTPKELRDWFEINREQVKNLTFENQILKLELKPQNKYKEKYVIAGIVNYSRGGWVYEEYKNTVHHIVEKKKPKIKSNSVLILIDIDMNPLTHEDIQHIDMSHFQFKIIILSHQAKIKYTWN